MEKVSICLCMIVRNESHIIERCLNSVKSILDYVSICDTGSTDDTVEIIERWCEKEKIPGKVHYHEFINFAYNRNLVFQLSKETYPQATYMLLMDADLTLTINASFSKQSLSADCYALKHRLVNGQMSYWNIRLIKTILPWKCVGVTHEYWTLDSEMKMDKQHDMIVEDYDDGGCKADKLERDIRLIKEELKKDIKIEGSLKQRYVFYLAYTYYILQKYKQAIKYFNLWLNSNPHTSFTEEAAYCYYRIGCCYEELALSVLLPNDSSDTSTNQVKKSIKYEAMAGYYYLTSWEMRPSRSEALYRLTKFYRMRESYNLALIYGLIGKSIEYSEEDSIFIEDDVYLYQFDYELAQIAIHIPGKEYLSTNAIQSLKSIKHLLPPHILQFVS